MGTRRSGSQTKVLSWYCMGPGSGLGNLARPYRGQVGIRVRMPTAAQSLRGSACLQKKPRAWHSNESQHLVPRTDTCCPVTIAAARGSYPENA